MERKEKEMANITVTPEQLTQISGQLNTGAANIDGLLQQLGAAVQPLQGDWAGTAQQRFEALWLEWQNGAKQVHEALTGISQLTAQAAQNYESTEASNASSFNS
jgi:6 kDa early secretory antigenic target